MHVLKIKPKLDNFPTEEKKFLCQRDFAHGPNDIIILFSYYMYLGFEAQISKQKDVILNSIKKC